MEGPYLVEWVVMTHDSPNVPKYFQSTSGNHGRRETDEPLRQRRLQDEAEKRQAEQCKEGCVRTQAREVVVVGRIDGTCLERASLAIVGDGLGVTDDPLVKVVRHFWSVMDKVPFLVSVGCLTQRRLSTR